MKSRVFGVFFAYIITGSSVYHFSFRLYAKVNGGNEKGGSYENLTWSVWGFHFAPLARNATSQCHID